MKTGHTVCSPRTFLQFHSWCSLCVLLLLGSLRLDEVPKCLLKQWNMGHFVTFWFVCRSAFAAPGTEVPVSFTAARSFNRQFPEPPETTCKCLHDCTIIEILQYLFYRKLWILTLYPSSGQSRNQQWFEGQVTGCSHLWKALNSGTNAWKRYIMTRMPKDLKWSTLCTSDLNNWKNICCLKPHSACPLWYFFSLLKKNVFMP